MLSKFFRGKILLITGGAGFIASHLADELLNDGNKIIVYDNLSTGRKEFIAIHLGKSNFRFIQADLRDFKLLNRVMKKVDWVFHFAAHADVRSGYRDHFIDHRENLEMTHSVLEAMCKNKVGNIVFSSTSNVYGDAQIHPTPESHELRPTSLHGASKASSEVYIHAYSSYYRMKCYIFRLVSFLGERANHGLVIDVLKKIRKNPLKIELLSDGTPRKSSVYVKDGINAILTVINKARQQFNIYNVGHDQVLTVSQMVDIICDAAGYPAIKKKWLGSQSNWKGDNNFVLLSTEKLKKLSWQPSVSLENGIRITVRYLLDNDFLLK